MVKPCPSGPRWFYSAASSKSAPFLSPLSFLSAGLLLATCLVGHLTVVSCQSSTDNLIRDIVLNQSTAYYDELAMEHLLAAANATHPPQETWDKISDLLAKANSKREAPVVRAPTTPPNFENDTELRRALNQLGVNLPPSPQISSKQGKGGPRDHSNVTITKNLEPLESAINEFPPDFMSDEIRQKGGFIVHIAIFVYLSLVLAVICDNYFLKSLEYISEALHLPSDIAGATFMAIGTSAPELFTSVIGVFISDNDIGTGTIVGSAVFNLIAIPGACGFAAAYNLKVMPKITAFPIIRDTIFYVLTIITLILCIKDNQVDWIESITLIALYIVYIIIMYFNAQVSHMIEDKPSKMQLSRRDSDSSCLSDSDDLMRAKRKLAKAGMLDESRPLLLPGSLDDSGKRMSPPPAYQSNGSTYQPRNSHRVRAASYDCAPMPLTTEQVDYSRIHLALTDNGKFKEVVSSDYEKSYKEHSKKGSQIDLEQSIDLDDIDTDWSDNPVIKVLIFPFTLIFLFTLPKPTRFCFVLTFVSSIIWIACLTYFIVWMVTLVGYTLGIPDTVSGITILAAGTSIPELISSYLIVKKAGLADMAICNSIGSNIFDILFCLGLPWLLKTFTVMVTNGFGFATLAASSIPIQSTALPLTSLTLLLTIGAMLGIFKVTQWRLSLQTGILCFMVYVVFVITSTMLELNV